MKLDAGDGAIVAALVFRVINDAASEWTAARIGGSGSWTVLTWEAQINGGSWQTIATGTPSYVRRIYVNDQYVMNLRLTGTSAEETVSGTLTVYANAP